MVSTRRGLEQVGPLRTAAALTRLNQRHGFVCPGCAWPEEHGGRRLVFVNPADLAALGFAAGDRVDLVSEFEHQGRRAKDFLIVPYPTPVGNAAACYPETNPLVPLDHTAKKSNTPASNADVIRVESA